MPYVDAVVAMTVMSVLLFVLPVCMLRECDGDGNAGVGSGGGVEAGVSIWVVHVVQFFVYCQRRTRYECDAWGERCRWSV